MITSFDRFIPVSIPVVPATAFAFGPGRSDGVGQGGRPRARAGAEGVRIARCGFMGGVHAEVRLLARKKRGK